MMSDNQLKAFFGVQSVVLHPIEQSLRIPYAWSISHSLPRASVLYWVYGGTVRGDEENMGIVWILSKKLVKYFVLYSVALFIDINVIIRGGMFVRKINPLYAPIQKKIENLHQTNHGLETDGLFTRFLTIWARNQ